MTSFNTPLKLQKELKKIRILILCIPKMHKTLEEMENKVQFEKYIEEIMHLSINNKEAPTPIMKYFSNTI